MKKIILVVSLAILSFVNVKAQDIWKAKTTVIGFFSQTSLENIDATSKTAAAILNVKSKNLFFKVSNTSFHFPKQLMEEHFNENYMESEKFPYSEFTGMLLDSANTDITKNGTYTMWISGKLTVHGVAKDYKTKCTLTVKDGSIRATTTFKVKIADHKIEVPSVVSQNIAEYVDVKVDCTFEPKK